MDEKGFVCLRWDSTDLSTSIAELASVVLDDTSVKGLILDLTRLSVLDGNTGVPLIISLWNEAQAKKCRKSLVLKVLDRGQVVEKIKRTGLNQLIQVSFGAAA